MGNMCAKQNLEDQAVPSTTKVNPVNATLEERVAAIPALSKANPDNICLNTFDKTYYDSLDQSLQEPFMQCLASGIENPDSGMGCYACQPEDYDRFKPFFANNKRPFANP